VYKSIYLLTYLLIYITLKRCCNQSNRESEVCVVVYCDKFPKLSSGRLPAKLQVMQKCKQINFILHEQIIRLIN